MTSRNTKDEQIARTYRHANLIMAESITARGFVAWAEADAVAEHMVERGYLTRTTETRHVETALLWCNDPNSTVPAHDVEVRTYRATEHGRECWVAGALLL
jgi:hypothetical protein